MKTASIIATLTTLAVATSACQKSAAPAAAASETTAAPISEAEAAKVADATVASWLSKDAARIKAMYASDIAGYDVMSPQLSADRASWDKTQEGFAALGFDGAKQRERKIQILSPDVFVMSGAWDVTNSAHPDHNGPIRCTAVYRRGTGDEWLISTEQCSAVPKPA